MDRRSSSHRPRAPTGTDPSSGATGPGVSAGVGLGTIWVIVLIVYLLGDLPSREVATQPPQRAAALDPRRGIKDADPIVLVALSKGCDELWAALRLNGLVDGLLFFS